MCWPYSGKRIQNNPEYSFDWHAIPTLRFHSRGQHLCKFIGTKESVYIRKEFNSHRTGLGHQQDRRFIVLEHKYGLHDVMWKHNSGISGLKRNDDVKIPSQRTPFHRKLYLFCRMWCIIQLVSFVVDISSDFVSLNSGPGNYFQCR